MTKISEIKELSDRVATLENVIENVLGDLFWNPNHNSNKIKKLLAKLRSTMPNKKKKAIE